MGQAVLSDPVNRNRDGVPDIVRFTGFVQYYCIKVQSCRSQPPVTKGNRVNIPDPVHGDWCMFRAFFVRHAPSAVTQPTSEMSARVLGRVLFSLLGVHPPLESACPEIGGYLRKAPPSCGVPERSVRP
uniref:Clone ZZD247 mRNA sequence n=1 Tax=Schistosoma japonicum TaxID=6182 RepID=Q86EK8_SCHJA|nr:hypothetical protein [Schistosoma japonicum]